jgi:hypothetical protein
MEAFQATGGPRCLIGRRGAILTVPFWPLSSLTHSTASFPIDQWACLLRDPEVRDLHYVLLCGCRNRTEWRGGFPRGFPGPPGARSYFHLSFRRDDYGEDDRGDLLFTVGYRASWSWLKPSLGMERGAGSDLSPPTPLPSCLPFSSSLETLAAAAARGVATDQIS